MKLHRISNSSNKEVIQILKDNFSQISDKNIIKNYHPKFDQEPANIFFILNSKNNRYEKGCYYVLENNREYICSAGWNEYEYDNSIALALTRAYVNPKHRAKYYMGKFILPEIINETVNYNKIYITSNSYNSAIYQYFVRADQNKTTALFNNWPDIYRRFKPVGIKTIYNTDQYVVEYIR